MYTHTHTHTCTHTHTNTHIYTHKDIYIYIYICIYILYSKQTCLLTKKKMAKNEWKNDDFDYFPALCSVYKN